MSEQPSYRADMFEPAVGSDFLLRGQEGRTATLRLTDVAAGRSTPGLEQFSLFFRGPQEGPDRQDVYRLEHGDLGDFELFLVPVALDDEGYTYQAAFTTFVDDEGKGIHGNVLRR